MDSKFAVGEWVITTRAIESRRGNKIEKGRWGRINRLNTTNPKRIFVEFMKVEWEVDIADLTASKDYSYATTYSSQHSGGRRNKERNYGFNYTKPQPTIRIKE